MNDEQWNAFDDECDKLLNKESGKNKYTDYYEFKSSDLNHLWQLIRTAIKSAAIEHIPNHKSYSQ